MTLTDIEKSLFEEEKKEELKATLNMISNWMVLPLYFLFWIADIIYVPELKWQFLALRSAVVPTSFLIQYMLKKVQTLRQCEWLALFYILVLASVINAMVGMIGDNSTPYYAGLNLVAIGSLTFIPWSRLFFILANFVIFLPYYLIFFATKGDDFKVAIVNSFFIVGTVVITAVIRLFNHKLRILEFKGRIQLNDEIGNRDKLIIEKTDEGMRLAGLSRQFSPQVVSAIKENKINLNSDVHRAKICAMFVDIVNSTERVARVDKDKVHNSITQFADDTIRILLKYDITVDKFLGDGILAFSNDPVKHDDFVQRVLYASFEIIRVIKSKEEFYEDNWLSPMQVKIGVSVGFANVGFYGSSKYYKSYTAIGPVVNLASRLCSIAKPNQVIADADVVSHLKNKEFSVTAIGKLNLKGFENDVIKGFEVSADKNAIPLSDSSLDCSACGEGLLQLENEPNGLYILKCSVCGHIEGTPKTSKAA